MMVNDINDLSVSEYVSSPASLISPFSTIRYKLVNVFQASPSYNNYKSTANPPICEGQWVHTFNTNIHPYFYMAKYTLPLLSRGSAVINNASINASINAYIGRPDLLDYTSTKGAIISFTRDLSNQYVGRDVRVNAVAPGPVQTPLIPAAIIDEALKSFTAPMGRPAQPRKIAACFVFLVSIDSSAISSQTLHPWWLMGRRRKIMSLL